MTKAFFGLMLAGALMLVGLPLAAQQAEQPDPSQQIFASLDTNQDGELSQSEFAAMFEGRPEQVSDEDKEREFKTWDGDSSGSISKEEFKSNYQPEQQGQ